MCWKATNCTPALPSDFTAHHCQDDILRVCVCVGVVCDWGREYDERNVLSILSRGDVLKGTLLLINSWDPKEKGTFCGFAEIKRKKKKCSLLAFLQTPHALGATSSMRDILSLVSFPIYYSQLCEKHWWRDQQQSLTIYPGATASYSCAKENLNNRGSREWRGCEVDKSWWRRRALIFQGRYGFNAN